jgi:hypothetical protein
LTINPDKNSGTSPRTRTDIMTNQNTPVTGTVYAYLCPPVLCLLKPVTHVCAIKMAEDWLGAHSASSHGFHEFKPQYGKKKDGES